MQMHLVCKLLLLTEDQVSHIEIDPLCDLPPKHFLLTSKFLADFMTTVSYLNKQNKEKKNEVLCLVSMHEQEALIYLLSCLHSSNCGYLTRLFIIHRPL